MERDPLWASREGASVGESCAARPGTKVPCGRVRVPVLPRGWLGDQPQLSRPRDGLGAVGRAELVQDVADVLLDGVQADHELLGHALVRFALGEQADPITPSARSDRPAEALALLQNSRYPALRLGPTRRTSARGSTCDRPESCRGSGSVIGRRRLKLIPAFACSLLTVPLGLSGAAAHRQVAGMSSSALRCYSSGDVDDLAAAGAVLGEVDWNGCPCLPRDRVGAGLEQVG